MIKEKRKIGRVVIITAIVAISLLVIVNIGNERTSAETSYTFRVRLTKDAVIPLLDTPIYVYDRIGNYLGISGITNDTGQVSFCLSERSYKFKACCLGYDFWSDVVVVPGTLSLVMVIPHKDVSLTVLTLVLTNSFAIWMPRGFSPRLRHFVGGEHSDDNN